MDQREKVARALESAKPDPGVDWTDWLPWADAAIAAIATMDTPAPADDAIVVAQLAATLSSGHILFIDGTLATQTIANARRLLAESRRQVAAATEGEG